MKEARRVQVLHKCKEKGGLAVGETFRFQSGDRYTVQPSGAVINADPKPYRGKRERRKYLAERRKLRAQA